MFGLQPTVTLVNRVVDEAGKPITQYYTFDGRSVAITTELQVPLGVARILIHNSMWKLDPTITSPEYKLGCPELDLPVEPITPDMLASKNELLDRSKMAHGAKVKAVHIHNPIIRTTPISLDGRGGDRAFPGYFQETP